MKVTKASSANAPNLGDGVVYVVLGIQWLGNGPVRLILLDEEGLPTSVDAATTTTVDERIPATWTASIDTSGLTIQPAAWQVDGFWHAYWGEWHPATVSWGRADAKRLYDAEVGRMLDER